MLSSKAPFLTAAQLAAVALLLLLAIGQQPIAADEADREEPSSAGQRSAAAIVYRLLAQESVEYGADVAARLSQRMQESRRITEFLRQRGVAVDRAALDRQLEIAERILAKHGHTLGDATSESGITEAELRDAISLPVAWNQYLTAVLTEDRLEAAFTASRRYYDGTRIELLQIFLPPGPAARDIANRVVEKIENGALTFSSAAATYSKSPSGATGGNVGWIGATGDVPPAVAKAAFALKPGELSVVESSIGVHILRVARIEPGFGSLEDARARVIGDLSKAIWDEILAATN